MNTSSSTLKLACALIECPSVTPEDGDCQAIMMARLSAIGFICTPLPFGEVKNFWALRPGSQSAEMLMFAGHTDVVPTGPEEQWQFPPFSATLTEQGELCGRGAADMKGSLAAMVTACERFIQQHPNPKRGIGFLITSDEEGPANDGTVKVVEWLQQNQLRPDWCIVGEPSSTDQLGDVIKNGRRGSLNAMLTVRGQQGHVAYPQLANNPIHQAMAALAELCAQQWDKGNTFFPATSFQISNINAGTGATNVIPGELSVAFNFRFSTELTVAQIKQRTHKILDNYGLDYQLDWNLSGEPFITEAGALLDAVRSAIVSVTGRDTELSTAGGTSDGRFIAPMGTQVIELGPCNASIHKVNERIKASDLDVLSAIYEQVLVQLCR